MGLTKPDMGHDGLKQSRNKWGVKCGFPVETAVTLVKDVRMERRPPEEIFRNLYLDFAMTWAGKMELDGEEANTADCNQERHLSIKQRCSKTYFFFSNRWAGECRSNNANLQNSSLYFHMKKSWFPLYDV